VKAKDTQADVISYQLIIEPKFDRRFVKGTVEIDFLINSNMDSVVFKSGNRKSKWRVCSRLKK